MATRRIESHVRDGILVGAAVSVFGAGFGVLAVSNGLSLAQTSAMSLLVFTGASQFAAVGVVATGGSGAAAVTAALVLAARNGFYGITMGRHVRGALPARILAAHLTIDESTGLAMAQTDRTKVAPAFWAAGLSVFAFWNLGTLVGALGGDAIGDPETIGLDAAFPAGFVSLAAPAMRHRPGLVAAGLGATITALTTPFVAAGVPILLASIGAMIALAVAGRPPEVAS